MFIIIIVIEKSLLGGSIKQSIFLAIQPRTAAPRSPLFDLLRLALLHIWHNFLAYYSNVTSRPLIFILCNIKFTDLLTISPHTPSTEPVRYDKKDGHWYSHDAVNAKGTSQKKG